MLQIVLYEPEIPPNTGNIIRLCANFGVGLHLIHPLGFQLTEKGLRRAGLDYAEWIHIQEYNNYQQFLQSAQPARIFACTTKATQFYTTPTYKPDDFFLFGPESRGLPQEILTATEPAYQIKIPMKPYSRSLNLSNAVAIILAEALRQIGFPAIEN